MDSLRTEIANDIIAAVNAVAAPPTGDTEDAFGIYLSSDGITSTLNSIATRNFYPFSIFFTDKDTNDNYRKINSLCNSIPRRYGYRAVRALIYRNLDNTGFDKIVIKELQSCLTGVNALVTELKQFRTSYNNKYNDFIYNRAKYYTNDPSMIKYFGDWVNADHLPIIDESEGESEGYTPITNPSADPQHGGDHPGYKDGYFTERDGIYFPKEFFKEIEGANYTGTLEEDRLAYFKAHWGKSSNNYNSGSVEKELKDFQSRLSNIVKDTNNLVNNKINGIRTPLLGWISLGNQIIKKISSQRMMSTNCNYVLNNNDETIKEIIAKKRAIINRYSPTLVATTDKMIEISNANPDLSEEALTQKLIYSELDKMEIPKKVKQYYDQIAAFFYDETATFEMDI